jgi:hypothetical protein
MEIYGWSRLLSRSSLLRRASAPSWLVFPGRLYTIGASDVSEPGGASLLISPYFSNYMLTFVGFYSAAPNHVMAPFG